MLVAMFQIIGEGDEFFGLRQRIYFARIKGEKHNHRRHARHTEQRHQPITIGIARKPKKRVAAILGGIKRKHQSYAVPTEPPAKK